MRLDTRPILALCLLILQTACQGNQPPTSNPTLAPAFANSQPNSTRLALSYRTVALSGEFVFAPGDSSIWLQDAATLVAKPLLKHSEVEYYESPSFSPDGSQIVYVRYTFDQEGGQIKEIHVIATDGTNDRVLFKPDAAGLRTFLSDPRYSPDDNWIYFSVSTIIDELTGKQANQIVRGPISGGGWQVVVEGADHPRLSKDGRHLAFLRFNPQTFSSSLWVANPDGSNPRQILPDDVFAGVIGQSFSPDDSWIVFAASGPPNRALPENRLRLIFVPA